MFQNLKFTEILFVASSSNVANSIAISYHYRCLLIFLRYTLFNAYNSFQLIHIFYSSLLVDRKRRKVRSIESRSLADGCRRESGLGEENDSRGSPPRGVSLSLSGAKPRRRPCLPFHHTVTTRIPETRADQLSEFVSAAAGGRPARDPNN